MKEIFAYVCKKNIFSISFGWNFRKQPSSGISSWKNANNVFVQTSPTRLLPKSSKFWSADWVCVCWNEMKRTSGEWDMNQFIYLLFAYYRFLLITFTLSSSFIAYYTTYLMTTTFLLYVIIITILCHYATLRFKVIPWQ
jgi:hypothetical protein